ncbi:MAG TPA: 5'/3'-nucleotidase SurE [bacterium]
MRILITNDDGITAPGIAALWRAVRDLGEVTVVAPDSERSAVGHAITLADPLRVADYEGPDGLVGHAVSGTPADCVKIGVRAILRQLPDLVLSGINQGANMGTNVLYSGTVSAATEAAMLGLPAAAFSLADRHFPDFSAAAGYARRLALEIARHGLPRGVSLNVNVPPLPAEEIRGAVLTRQGRVRVAEQFDRRTDPRERHYYWMVAERLEDEAAAGDQVDDAAVRAGFISVTPINFDLTDDGMLASMGRWELDPGTFRNGRGR